MSQQPINRIMGSLPRKPTAGKIYVGPEFYGCCNTGSRPALLKSRQMANHPRLNNGYRFAVGPEIELEQSIYVFLCGKASHKTKHEKRNRAGQVMPRWTVYFFKTYKAAKAKFRELCEKRIAENEEARAEHQQATEDANSCNPQQRAKGAAKLLDH